ncbi:hypothetical protein AN958_09285 [Leucoagaricus sp. SymC.cos]|nr:hypothetical protein AN958_09285 [Leucoagaricus sp. SymC.cos]
MPNGTLPRPSEHYYLKGGDLYFLVDQVLFRVHSYFFLRESEYWKNRLVGPANAGPDDPLLEGNGSTSPIQINDMKHLDFTRFLWVIYNTKYGDFSKAKVLDWITILRLATIWQFAEVKHLAIQHLEAVDMDPLKRIKLYQENGVHEKYLFPLYVHLASQDEFIGLEDARTLGMETYVLLQQARERLRGQALSDDPSRSPVRAGTQLGEVAHIVALTFNISTEENDMD